MGKKKSATGAARKGKVEYDRPKKAPDDQLLRLRMNKADAPISARA